ncbi:homocysteine S-methyltransferase family protein [Pseudonocardia kunmingensis]|uniref:Betaine-homocysteine S-methyltransferase n=1 Tax=Pseudonocardia kunmingensis TaxID=630975 RepID=A0A543D9G4_9PSEU|nr:homocysteine S-methyltransferase family protein [Pseudonocardia kunmingensis]TQM05946.1 betaine-homocysteine S-methyltransferase [Pseudonocardia kunmingensis]
MTASPSAARGLAARLADGPVICAEGYLFELERRGYLQAGAFVPEVVLEHPERVTALHEEFVHAGSDVVEAFTYYTHREKLRVIGAVDLLEPLNREALALASRVAADTGTLLAGNICNTNVYDPADPASADRARAMFTEQVGWAAEAGVDYVIGETFGFLGEALVALEVVREAGLPAVITMNLHEAPRTREGTELPEAMRRLADAGASVVGLNCGRGPATMLPLLAELVDAVPVPVAALPVPYRTDAAHPHFQALVDEAYPGLPSGRPFPTALDPFTCNRYEIADFARAATDAGAHYLGLCCGAAPHHVRAMAEALGRTPPASRYSEDMSRHVYFGSDPTLARLNLEYGRTL